MFQITDKESLEKAQKELLHREREKMGMYVDDRSYDLVSYKINSLRGNIKRFLDENPEYKI